MTWLFRLNSRNVMIQLINGLKISDDPMNLGRNKRTNVTLTIQFSKSAFLVVGDFLIVHLTERSKSIPSGKKIC